MHADIAASGTSRFVRNESIQRMGTISRVSIGGPTTTTISKMTSGSPSKVGALSSVIIPDAARIKTIIIEGKKLISPARSTYLPIETRLSKSIESSRPRCVSGFGISCCSTSRSGSKCQLLSCPVRPESLYTIYPLKVNSPKPFFRFPAISEAGYAGRSIRNFLLYLILASKRPNNSFLLTFPKHVCICPFLNFIVEIADW